ncbi:MAG: HNH endonuclease [Flavobacteriales bacterium]|nr:HNH endonuclease [Flavobacteriales bacterium]
MRTPTKPFANYKWRWAVVTPTESLNDPPVFLGILRVLRLNEYSSFSSKEVNEGLQIVQKETGSTVNLVRSTDRNIFRNSGQYWKGLGMLDEGRRGQIILSNFGRKLADGEVTQVQFAITIIKTFELPNRFIETNTSDWDSVGLSFKPFEIILTLIRNLQLKFGNEQGYITTEELIKIIIPLVGDNGTNDEFVEAIVLFRRGKLDTSSWPDCAPDSNDKRMVREFLLYLSNYGFCNAVAGTSNSKEKYYLSSISVEEIKDLFVLVTKENELDRIENIIRASQIPANIERKRVMREVLERPNQNRFRKMILEAYGSTCLITGVKMDTVLEAAHIKPVKHKGADHLINGICLRADIHTLYDANHLKISTNGDIILSSQAKQKENYSFLPSNIIIPHFVDVNQLDWRMKYY